MICEYYYYIFLYCTVSYVWIILILFIKIPTLHSSTIITQREASTLVQIEIGNHLLSLLNREYCHVIFKTQIIHTYQVFCNYNCSFSFNESAIPPCAFEDFKYIAGIAIIIVFRKASITIIFNRIIFTLNPTLKILQYCPYYYFYWSPYIT